MTISDSLFDYAVNIRRELHRHPETGFELYNTVAVVERELDSMGIPWTEKYGKCSVAAEIASPVPGAPVLGIRADMDALPVQEKNDVPYKSQIDGKMHACGHDSHTAVLLATAKLLKERQSDLKCSVRLLFQPSEECAESGAKMMVENGAAEGLDAVICTHCENTLDAGKLGCHPGDYMAACIPFTVKFIGKAAHAAIRTGGIDAIAMAVKAYTAMENAVREEAGDRKYIWSVGVFNGGEAHNIIAPECTLKISFRYYDREFAMRAVERVQKICSSIAEEKGGRVEFDWSESAAALHNNEKLSEQFYSVITEEKGFTLEDIPARMSSEDFSWFSQAKPGLIFRFGTRNEALGCTAIAHRSDFLIDESGMRQAIAAFAEFALNFEGFTG